MKNVFFSLIFIMISLYGAAQLAFEKNYGGTGPDYGNSIAVTPAGGYIIAGTTNSFGAGCSDVYLLKTNVNGDTIWTKTYGSSDCDSSFSVAVTSDGGYIITGTSNYDVLLIRTDSSGNEKWTKYFGGADLETGNEVIQTSDGGYVIVGSTRSMGPTPEDVYLIKTDTGGTMEWYKTYATPGFDIGYAVAQTTDGGYILSGYTTHVTPGIADFYLIKTDSIGDTVWTKKFGGPGADCGYDVLQTNDGGFIVAGGTQSPMSFKLGIILIRMNAGGDTLWTSRLNGCIYDHFLSITNNSDSGFYLTGAKEIDQLGNLDAYLAKVDINGDTLWTKTFGGPNFESGRGIARTPEGGCILVGFTNSTGYGDFDVYLVKFGKNGNVSGLNSDGPFTSTSFSLSPNPTSGMFTIHFSNDLMETSKTSIKVYNMFGKEILSKTVNPSFNENFQIDLTGYAKGIYIVQTNSGDAVVSRKIVLE